MATTFSAIKNINILVVGSPKIYLKLNKHLVDKRYIFNVLGTDNDYHIPELCPTAHFILGSGRVNLCEKGMDGILNLPKIAKEYKVKYVSSFFGSFFVIQRIMKALKN